MPRKRKFGSNEQHHFINAYYVTLGLFFILFQILSSIFVLPILIGFFFCYMYVLLREKEITLYDLDFRWYFSLAYLVFIDITHDFYLFSSWIAFFLFYYFCANWIKTNFKIGKLLPIFFSICAYLLLYISHNVLCYIDSAKFSLLGMEYFVDMFAESALCYLIFKDKIR